MKRVLITGGDGRLGSKITDLLSQNPADRVHSPGATELDVTDFTAVRAAVNDIKPTLVIHCAAWTDVDGCAKDPERALAVNGYGAGNVAVAAANRNIPIAYISTNEVFDGRVPGSPYREYDTPNPLNPYGYSKFVGEQEVTRLNPRHYIIRTAWLFAHDGRNFMQVMINAAAAGKDLRVVTNEVANPTYTDDLAHAVLRLTNTGRFGTYHLVNDGHTSRWNFARYILDQAGYADTPIQRISAAEWPRPSTPPMYCGLQNTAAAALGVRLRPWQAAVDAFLTREGLLSNDA